MIETPPTPDELAARYDDVYRKSERLELSNERFDRGIERGDDGRWGVGALVTRGERVLFAREGDLWLLPGGRLEPGETPAEGAAREVQEETGVAVVTSDLVAIAEQRFVREVGNDSFEFYFATFLAEPESKTGTEEPVPADDRIAEVAWLTSVPENTFDRELVARLVDTHV